MMLDFDPVKTIPLVDPGYVFEQRWGDARFDQFDQIQLSTPTGENAIRVSFLSRNKVLLGRDLSNAADDLTMQGYDSEATIPTISDEFREQILQRAAQGKEEQERSINLHASDQRVIDLQQFDMGTVGVSRQHALLEKDSNYVTLTDLHSTNGTRLNGTLLYPMQRRIIRNDDKMQLGDLLLWVRFCRVG